MSVGGRCELDTRSNGSQEKGDYILGFREVKSTESLKGSHMSQIPSHQIPSQLLTEALQMPTLDRGRLAALLIESLESETETDVDLAWAEEISRRLSDIDSGRVKMISEEDARRIIRGQNDSASS